MKKTIEGKRLGLTLGLFYFILNSAQLTRDVRCSRLYFDGKNMKSICQMNRLTIRTCNTITFLWYKEK